MKYSKIFIIVMSIFFYSCSGNYEQHYDKFADFEKANQRNKGWFPAIISPDACDLKNSSCLDPLCAFGSFSYTKNNFYDSVFTAQSVRQIDFSLFEQKVKEHDKNQPDWFLNPGSIPQEKFETIQIGHFYLARKKGERKIYFVLSN